MVTIEARGLSKPFGGVVALDGVDLHVEEGCVLGILGPNGAGKSTLLHAILGLVRCRGSLRVLGRDPWRERDVLAREVAFVADAAVLPRWIRVSRLLDYVAGVHPHFDRRKAEDLLEHTGIRRGGAVGALSKGMVAQLHLALALAIDAKLLVLDEPTLGLDPVFRERFYDMLLGERLDPRRTVLIATHEISEVQDVLTDFIFLDRGRVAIASGMESVETRWHELRVRPEYLGAARSLGPIRERESLGRRVLLFDGVDPNRLAALGEVRRPDLAELYAAMMRELEVR